MATKYIVLRKVGVGGWAILGQEEASGPVVARKKVTEEEGEYLIVPRRNATFESVSVEQPPPKTTSELMHPDSYLGEQPTLPLDEEPLGESLKVADEPAAA